MKIILVSKIFYGYISLLSLNKFKGSLFYVSKMKNSKIVFDLVIWSCLFGKNKNFEVFLVCLFGFMFKFNKFCGYLILIC